MALNLYVPDVDATVAKAEAGGATILTPVEDTFYGSRRCRIRDPYGHRWLVATHVHDVSSEDYKKAVDDFSETSLS